MGSDEYHKYDRLVKKNCKFQPLKNIVNDELEEELFLITLYMSQQTSNDRYFLKLKEAWTLFFIYMYKLIYIYIY